MLRLWRQYGAYVRSNASRGTYTPAYVCIAILGLCGGAGVEYAMSEWRPNGINFYDVYKGNLVRTMADEIEEIERAGPAVRQQLQQANKK